MDPIGTLYDEECVFKMQLFLFYIRFYSHDISARYFFIQISQTKNNEFAFDLQTILYVKC